MSNKLDLEFVRLRKVDRTSTGTDSNGFTIRFFAYRTGVVV